MPEVFATSLCAVRQCGCGPDDEVDPGWYPGSPWITRHFLRSGDRLVLSELHPKMRRASRVPLRVTGR